MTSAPSTPFITTGRFTIVPTPMIAVSGMLRTGVSKSAPPEPVLVTVKVEPDSSSGPIFESRVRAARSLMEAAIPGISLSPAFLITGTSRPRGVSTAMPTCS